MTNTSTQKISNRRFQLLYRNAMFSKTLRVNYTLYSAMVSKNNSKKKVDQTFTLKILAFFRNSFSKLF